jgi:hypothetical protein
MKSIDSLRPEDFDEVAVWMSSGDGMARPVPGVDEIADGVRGLWVAVHGKLADETPLRGVARVECPPPAFYDHILLVDDREIRPRFDGQLHLIEPEAIASALNRALTQIFPIWIRAEVKAECSGDMISQEIDVTGPANALV